jgi:hypothetical protein
MNGDYEAPVDCLLTRGDAREGAWPDYVAQYRLKFKECCLGRVAR